MARREEVLGNQSLGQQNSPCETCRKAASSKKGHPENYRGRLYSIGKALLRLTTWWHQHITINRKVRPDLHQVRGFITDPVPLPLEGDSKAQRP